MSEKIKFIVDDLADYTKELLNYSEHIIYLPKKIEIRGEFVETQPTYSQELDNKLHRVFNVKSALMDTERYRSILESALTSYPDYKFIYFVPYTFGAFEKDIENLSITIEDLNSKNDNRIICLKSNHFGSSLHYIVRTTIESCIKSSVDDLDLIKSIFNDLNSSIYQYFSLYQSESAINLPSVQELIKDKNTYLFKIENSLIERVNVEESAELTIPYIDKISEILNKLSDNYSLVFSTYPVNDETVIGLEYFKSKLNKKDNLIFYAKSQSNYALGADGDSLAVITKK